MNFVPCQRCGGSIPEGWRYHGRRCVPLPERRPRRPRPPKSCALCGGECHPRNTYCGKSCAARAKWRAGVLTADMVGRRRSHRRLPLHLAEVAAAATEELAVLIQDQHDDDVPWVRRGMGSRLDAMEEWDQRVGDPWADPTAELALLTGGGSA